MDWIIEKLHSEALEEKARSYKRICELIIIVFFILLYIFLKNTRVPQLNFQLAETYKKIDWQRYMPEEMKTIKKHEIPTPSNQLGTSNPEQSASADRVEVIDTEILTSDISTILNQQPDRSLENVPERKTARDLTFKMPADPNDFNTVVEQPQDYFKDNATNLLPRNFVEPKNVGPTVTINDVTPNHETAGKSQRYPKRNQSPITPDKIVPETGVIEIPLISSEKVTNKRDISVILDELMLWMKRHPYEFNQVTKSFIMYEPNDLTSKVVFRNKNRVFELHLLYKEKSKEIRICLIEGDQSTMLIDSGFKKQSNYLRTGIVGRTQDNTIFSFGTSQYPASEKTTAEFYQFFLSWWEQAKLEK